MSIPTGLVMNARETARTAAADARPGASAFGLGQSPLLRIGKITVASGTDYTVRLLADDGTLSTTLTHVWAVPSTDLSAGDIVWVALCQGAAGLVPKIIGTPGLDFSGYFQGESDLGWAGCLAD